ncbi:MAG: hypothetical protein LLF76_13210 [Planctomycetaceae bacterium]|nr:hypothetical protein [Planctomycetaceae bacterium]
MMQIFEDPTARSYYPEAPRKSRLRIWLEHLWWMLRHGEIHYFYYFYGCDRKDGPPVGQFAGKKEFVRLRDRLNAAGQVGGRVINYNCLLQDKFLFSQYLKSLGFATPPVYALADRSSVCRTSPRRTFTWEEFVRYENGTWFIKDVIGERGEHVFRLELKDGSIRLGQKAVSLDELKAGIGEKNILQEPVTQHELLNAINPSCVNTIRLVTARSQRGIEALSAMLRLGVGQNVCDNLALGGIAVGVNLATGELCERGIYKPGFGKWALRHPDSGFAFKGARLPFFAEAVEKARRLHDFFYGTHSIGWDIAFGADGPVFLEGNNSWEIPTLQVFDRDLIAKFKKTLDADTGNKR